MADKPPLAHDELQRVLRRLQPLIAERRIILVGGQAVSIWMRMLQPMSDELGATEPVTSKDIEDERVRTVLRLNERVFRKCLRDRRFRDVYLDHGIDPFAALLVADPRLPDQLRERRYPQMREQLADCLKRDRRNRRRRKRAVASRTR